MDHHQSPPHQLLDTDHREMIHHIEDLLTLANRLTSAGIDSLCRELARRVDEFFSTTARKHHELEEQVIFQSLLVVADPGMAKTVERLRQDHGWIEENWLVLQPQLSTIAQNLSHHDPAEFQHAARLFVDLLYAHLELEESLIYPEYKRHLTAAYAAALRRGTSDESTERRTNPSIR